MQVDWHVLEWQRCATLDSQGAGRLACVRVTALCYIGQCQGCWSTGMFYTGQCKACWSTGMCWSDSAVHIDFGQFTALDNLFGYFPACLNVCCLFSCFHFFARVTLLRLESLFHRVYSVLSAGQRRESLVEAGEPVSWSLQCTFSWAEKGKSCWGWRACFMESAVYFQLGREGKVLLRLESLFHGVCGVLSAGQRRESLGGTSVSACTPVVLTVLQWHLLVLYSADLYFMMVFTNFWTLWPFSMMTFTHFDKNLYMVTFVFLQGNAKILRSLTCVMQRNSGRRLLLCWCCRWPPENVISRTCVIHRNSCVKWLLCWCCRWPPGTEGATGRAVRAGVFCDHPELEHLRKGVPRLYYNVLQHGWCTASSGEIILVIL